MNKRSNEKGITLIALTVTIVLMMIIAGITISNSVPNYDSTRENVAVAELNMVRQAILEKKTTNDLTDGNYPGTQFSSKSEFQSKLDTVKNLLKTDDQREKLFTEEGAINVDNYLQYYEISNKKTDSNTESDFEKLGIQSSRGNDEEYIYIVNYSTGSVLNESMPVTNKGTLLYIK